MGSSRPFGNIRKLKSGRYQARYYHLGNQVPADTTFATKAETRAWLATMETEILGGRHVDPSSGRETFGNYSRRWQWTIAALHRNGDITAAGSSGTVRLPADYVTEHVELGYAQTSHAAQGCTVDRSILVLDELSDVRGIYVPFTRGRHHNDAYITTTGEQTAVDVFAESIARSWIDQPAIARQAELGPRLRRSSTRQ